MLWLITDYAPSIFTGAPVGLTMRRLRRTLLTQIFGPLLGWTSFRMAYLPADSRPAVAVALSDAVHGHQDFVDLGFMQLAAFVCRPSVDTLAMLCKKRIWAGRGSAEVISDADDCR